ncbi:release factor glutamine methyltransferase [Paenibacillus cineris]|uniref:Release factor glutamine methyltransferase n=2 Tax=Paenibacillus cineris TaxID=237530 RepID=A0ABQ4LLA2_9BACL|nr:HemK/PrmC family methyltransferase [Paenibacillus cineris]GIO57175.1 release factor glutamine methyltransferase [Paenibacillus cineris]
MKESTFVMTTKQSIREAFAEASSFLAAHEVMEPQRNAQLLLEHVLGLSGAAYYMALPDPFPAERQKAWEEVISRKAAGEPAQYIIGEQEFYGIPFQVTPAVLIPRPETELLVEAVLQQAEQLWPQGAAPADAELPDREAARPAAQGRAAAAPGGGAGTADGLRPLVAADIGTGSGAIAVTLALHAPRWQVYASDISADALRVAARNAEANGAQVAFEEGNLLEPFAGRRVDILVSNPPYIPAADIPGLQPEVRDHEPRTALDGGADGLAPYRIMMQQLPLLQEPPRLIGFELGIGQAGEVADLLRQAGHWDEIMIIPDLAGIDRHVLGVRR